jgi:hypothetical protein
MLLTAPPPPPPPVIFSFCHSLVVISTRETWPAWEISGKSTTYFYSGSIPLVFKTTMEFNPSTTTKCPGCQIVKSNDADLLEHLKAKEVFVFVEGHGGGEDQSVLMGSLTTIYRNKDSHSHMLESHDWLKLNINSF